MRTANEGGGEGAGHSGRDGSTAGRSNGRALQEHGGGGGGGGVGAGQWRARLAMQCEVWSRCGEMYCILLGIRLIPSIPFRICSTHEPFYHIT